ncbi:glycosidase [Flavobacterium beibuense F44-8]|uniref:4-O-beta-D-mannosyl-D-glucose phosphorylase n=1 Tax=Flavobacterium beibuense F44-8 TaxID=1406840 RepID=A0A0A2LST5_9FLAO|nr:glycosidase [Flavobacterium beibuense F44-8]
MPNYESLVKKHQELIEKKNTPVDDTNGIYTRYKNPVVTAAHTPVEWRYDLNAATNPFGMERIGMNAAFNAGAMKWNGKYILAVRTEGVDRKSFFAIAESPNGVDNFKFWEKPCVIPQLDEPDTNVYDMRLIEHEDGWIYGIFCTERKDPNAPKGDTSAAVANAGIVRTKDLVNWERLPDLVSNTGQQRNVVLHPEFVNGKYALYTRPQDGFIDVGSGGGIGLGFVDDMTNPVVQDEKIICGKVYHTIYELKNGLGPAPIKTEKGWLHMAHGVRNTAAGLRYTLYMFMTDLNDISKVTHIPAGHFMGPEGEERVGDVSNVLFSNGWVADEDGTVYIYYASSDTRMHVAVSTVDKLVDYVMNTPEDTFTSAGSVNTIIAQVENNKKFL